MSSNNTDLSSLMPSHPLFGPTLSVKRAERHIYDLSVEIAAYIDRKPYSIINDIDGETGDKVERLCIRDDDPFLTGAQQSEMLSITCGPRSTSSPAKSSNLALTT